MKRSRVFTRVLLSVLLLFVASAALSGAMAAWTLSSMLDQQYRSKGTAIAETIASSSVEHLLLESPLATLQAMVDQYAETEGVAYILVRDRHGEAVVHTFVPEVPPVLCQPLGEVEATSGPMQIGGREYLDITAPILDGEIGQVHVGMDQATINRAFWRAMRLQALAGGVIGVAAVGGAYLLVRWVTRPLEQLTRHARKVAALDSLFAPTAPVAADLAPIAQRTDEVGQLARAMVHMLDGIGSREQRLNWAEQSLRRSEQHYRSLIENVGDVIVLLDPEGRARYVSPSLRAFLDFTPTEWVGRDITLLVHPDDREAFRRAVTDCLPRVGPDDPADAAAGPGEGASVEVRMVRADGELRIVDASLTNLLLDPAVAGMVVTLRDISDRKRTLELSRAREAAEEASRLKSELLANMSHEFFTPMHQLITLMQIMMLEDLDAEMRDNLQTMWTSANDLHGVLKNLLDFSKLEGGELRLEVGPVRLREVLVEVGGLLGPRAEAKGLRLTAEVSPDVPEVVPADADRLRQVLLHLVGNAIKFTEQGEVGVRAFVERPRPGDETVDWVPEEADRVAVRFEVRDTGAGIPPQKQARIFEPFVQGEGGLTRRHGGTGLGLAIARSLVGLMGGRLTLRSTAGEGSVFGFTLRVRALGEGSWGGKAAEGA